MRTKAGYLFMQDKEIYKNEALTVEHQVELLVKQGLLIPNTSEAEFHLLPLITIVSLIIVWFFTRI